MSAEHVFDFWQGTPALGSDIIRVTLHNPTRRTLRIPEDVRIAAEMKAHGEIVEGVDLSTLPEGTTVLPGQTLKVPVRLHLPRQVTSSLMMENLNVKKENCVLITLRIDGGNKLQIRCHCRTRLQSFLITFLDHDGSPNHAAVIAPISWTPKINEESKLLSFPILVSLAGVGVDARQAVDSHKYKKNANQVDYDFGCERAWTLGPQRGGAHN